MKASTGRRSGEKQLAPEADFTSYHGRPVLKETVWGPDVPGYLFLGGLGLLAVTPEGAKPAARLAGLGAAAELTAERRPGRHLLTGSAVTRFGVFEAGRASVRDPRYTVGPQRERLHERSEPQEKRWRQSASSWMSTTPSSP
jgi:hypothetical protein